LLDTYEIDAGHFSRFGKQRQETFPVHTLLQRLKPDCSKPLPHG